MHLQLGSLYRIALPRREHLILNVSPLPLDLLQVQPDNPSVF